MEDYITYELIGGGFPRHLHRISNVSLLLHTTHTIVAIVHGARESGWSSLHVH